jgi:hypothetical protein
VPKTRNAIDCIGCSWSKVSVRCEYYRQGIGMYSPVHMRNYNAIHIPSRRPARPPGKKTFVDCACSCYSNYILYCLHSEFPNICIFQYTGINTYRAYTMQCTYATQYTVRLQFLVSYNQMKTITAVQRFFSDHLLHLSFELFIALFPKQTIGPR